MKTVTCILSLLVLSFTTLVSGQRIVALHSTTGVTMFSAANPLIDAYTAANSGDTLYLSGGSFSLPALFDKGLIIFGAGYHPDSTLATNPTLLTGLFNLGENADNLVVEGVQFAAGINLAHNISASYLSFKRCRINAGINFQGDLVNNTCVNNSFSECIFIGDIYLTNTTNTAIMNSVIQDRLISSKSNIFKNSVFLYNSGWSTGVLISPFNNEFSNNIFLDPSESFFIHAANDGNLFFNNVFVAANPNLGSNPISTGNYMGVPLADLFENHSGATFSYSSDFHLKSPGDYIGKDSSQAGIYGGVFPFKPGGVPTNPHINFKNISGTTTTDGKLNVQIKANAQSR